MRIFIGFDSKETVAFHVLSQSIHRYASKPVSITPLILSQLPMWRERTPTQSTEFSFSRFLVPWLCGYQGKALFLDSDILCRTDLTKLFDEDMNTCVDVVKHDYKPKAGNKFLNQPQSVYPKKNWSSVMRFNNPYCSVLTPEYVNTASGLELHQFKWCGDHMVGELPADYNHLVGEYKPNPDAKLIHYTLGTPCFKKYENCEFSNEWYLERNLMLGYKKDELRAVA